MSKKTGEAKLTNQIIKYLDSLVDKGLPLFYEHRSGTGGFNYKKGIPDFYVVLRGRHLEVELKTQNGKLSSMQEKFKYRCEKIWLIPYCCPRSLEEFKKFLEEYL